MRSYLQRSVILYTRILKKVKYNDIIIYEKGLDSGSYLVPVVRMECFGKASRYLRRLAFLIVTYACVTAKIILSNRNTSTINNVPKMLFLSY